MSFNGTRRKVASRRKPAAPPAIAPKTKEALLACRELPPEIRNLMVGVIKPIEEAAIGQDTFNRKGRAGFEGAPAAHAGTHLPDSQIDPLPVGTPGALDFASADVDGDDNNFARGDHGHRTPLTTKGDLFTATSSALARLGVGANGRVLEADSTQATGLKWSSQSQDATILAFVGIAMSSQVEGFI